MLLRIIRWLSVLLLIVGAHRLGVRLEKGEYLSFGRHAFFVALYGGALTIGVWRLRRPAAARRGTDLALVPLGLQLVTYAVYWGREIVASTTVGFTCPHFPFLEALIFVLLGGPVAGILAATGYKRAETLIAAELFPLVAFVLWLCFANHAV